MFTNVAENILVFECIAERRDNQESTTIVENALREVESITKVCDSKNSDHICGNSLA
jgi:hypothetical protein